MGKSLNNDSDQKPAAFLGTSSSAKTMSDGSLRIAVDISPQDAISAFTAFGTPGSAVGLAAIVPDVAVEIDRPKEEAVASYGSFAKDLKLSGFFRTPAVWEVVGTDKEYLQWLKQQPSARSGRFSEYDEGGDQWCIPAHVRRVEHGAGTAIKPPYSAIPLTNAEHQLSHQKGDSEIGSEQWWDKKRIKDVQEWAWESLKAQLGYGSWSMVPPVELNAWAIEKGVFRHLPHSYKQEIEIS